MYTDKPGEILTTSDENDLDLRPSLGMIVCDGGPIRDVVPGSPADKAALGPGMKLLAVNDRRFTSDRLKESVSATKGGEGQIKLLWENGDDFRSAVLRYDGGARYPHLERIPAATDRLSEIFKSTADSDK